MTEKQFTDEQRMALLKIIDERKKAVWVWALVGTWVKWAGMVLAALVAFKVLTQDWLRITFR